jgi:hypothetical protein
MVTFDKRRTIGDKLQGMILPNVVKQLNANSRNIRKVKICRGGNNCAEVSGVDSEGKVWRHVVKLDTQECLIESDNLVENHVCMLFHSYAHLENHV